MKSSLFVLALMMAVLATNPAFATPAEDRIAANTAAIATHKQEITRLKAAIAVDQQRIKNHATADQKVAAAENKNQTFVKACLKIKAATVYMKSVTKPGHSPFDGFGKKLVDRLKAAKSQAENGQTSTCAIIDVPIETDGT